jgi:hypothetical protein
MFDAKKVESIHEQAIKKAVGLPLKQMHEAMYQHMTEALNKEVEPLKQLLRDFVTLLEAEQLMIEHHPIAWDEVMENTIAKAKELAGEEPPDAPAH